MNHIRNIVFAAALLALTAGAALATGGPNPNSVVVIPRIFNDCPTSILTITNHYPSSLNITDEDLSCGGFANLHVWRYSEDGATEALFSNGSAFHTKFRLWTTGTSQGEAGLQIAPWWSEADGKFNCRTTDGEIAVFGGRLPFYSFTANWGLHYVKGTVIDLEATYQANGLSAADPGTIEYRVHYAGTTYSSGVLAFDEGNPSEDPPYGLWGILNQAKVGGYVQPYLQGGNPNANFTAEFTKFEFDNLKPVAVDPSSWGSVKALYR
jgi:hypothetical protein